MPHEDDLVLFLDEGLHRCQPIHRALDDLGIRYECHYKYFQKGVDDTAWMPSVGQKGWSVLTTDKDIRYNQLEIAIVRRYRMREYVFVKGNWNGDKMAEILRAAARDMTRLFFREEPPFIAYLSSTGKVTIRWPKP